MNERANTDWFRDAKWGVFMHYLAAPASNTEPYDMTVEAWNERIDNFDTAGLAAQLEEIGAGYCFITLGQNTGFYLSPNETYDSLVGRAPSHCSRRDLVAELAAELSPRGMPLMVYLPAHAAADDRQAVEGLKCTPWWDASAWQLRPGRYSCDEGEIDERLSKFQRNWEAVIREWSQRWSKSVSGWWFDGCYHGKRMYEHDDEPNWKSFAAAVKSGNPESLVAFNPGVKVPVVSVTEYEDYTAGEIANALPAAPKTGNANSGRCVDGAQYHILTYMGHTWGQGEPRFCDETVIGFTKDINAREGVVSWDIPPTKRGLIEQPFVEQLKGLRNATRTK